MRKSNLLLVLASLALAACESLPFVQPTIVEKKVPVAVPCAFGEKPVRPAQEYGALPAGTGVDYAVEALKRDVYGLSAYAGKLEARTAGCWR
jgi:hypothetical protein